MKVLCAGVLVLTLMAAIPDLPQLKQAMNRFAPVKLTADIGSLSAGDRRALVKLVEAAKVLDDLFLTQVWSGNVRLQGELARDGSDLGKARFAAFQLNKGPWSGLDDHAAFLPSVPPKKLPGANFYPEDMTREEFETWVKTLDPKGKAAAEGFFTTIRRGGGRQLHSVPYSEEYAPYLKKMAALLGEAEQSTGNATLKNFLRTRADAFLSNDYYESDVAWMDLDAPIEVTIGPYETYNDELFGYKAAFEAYVTLRDDAETSKVRFFSDKLQEIEDHLPLAPEYRNKKIGASAPIRVVNEILSAGDAAHGVRTAAFNLPNDERVIRAKGSKRVMLKNVQEAKFHAILEPIAARMLTPEARKDLSFDWFFTHILAHELTHGIGPHHLQKNGRETTPRLELKDLYSAVEEAKADVCGLFMLGYMLDSKQLPGAPGDAAKKLYTTFLASSFRTLRFGINEAHGKGMAIQVNYLMDKGAIRSGPDGTWYVVQERFPSAVRELAHDLLTLEAVGDYAGAKAMMDRLAVIRPEMKSSLERLRDLPTDILPTHATAKELAGPAK